MRLCVFEFVFVPVCATCAICIRVSCLRMRWVSLFPRTAHPDILYSVGHPGSICEAAIELANCSFSQLVRHFHPSTVHNLPPLPFDSPHLRRWRDREQDTVHAAHVANATSATGALPQAQSATRPSSSLATVSHITATVAQSRTRPVSANTDGSHPAAASLSLLSSLSAHNASMRPSTAKPPTAPGHPQGQRPNLSISASAPSTPRHRKHGAAGHSGALNRFSTSTSPSSASSTASLRRGQRLPSLPPSRPRTAEAHEVSRSAFLRLFT